MAKRITERDEDTGQIASGKMPKTGKHRVGPITIIRDIKSVINKKNS